MRRSVKNRTAAQKLKSETPIRHCRERSVRKRILAALLLLRELYPEVTEIGPALAEAGELLRIFDKIRLTLRNKPKV